ncbi:hypothetical protein [Deinococcus sp.]|uniref:hypothetical protein n=1 Tax=Deinococcus sp. TaxID=47478 RepID=UPI002869CFD5|nr:hypothetical protein [Deinococcus sp.]
MLSIHPAALTLCTLALLLGGRTQSTVNAAIDQLRRGQYREALGTFQEQARAGDV